MFTLPSLPYEYNALEPYIDTQTMHIHHEKHHAAYITNLNTALEKYPDLSEKTAEDLIKNLNALPEEIRTVVRNNGGGHVNHSFFWNILTAKGPQKPSESFMKILDETFESFEGFQATFTEAGMKRFGSGWAWLGIKNGTLVVLSTANQDSPLSEGILPILGLDVWEHAYYLHYQNKRADYITAWWNIVNWERVEELYSQYV